MKYELDEKMFDKIAFILEKDPDALFFLNMSDGLEAIDDIRQAGIDEGHIRFSMIQSTHFEQKNLDPAMNRLGADLLMNLALGRTCVIVDYGTDKVYSRTVYQGVPFIKYALERAWFDKTPEKVIIVPRVPDAQPQNVANLFDRWYHNLNRRTKGFLKRFRIYATQPEIRARNNGEAKLVGISVPTLHDGHFEYYADLVAEKFL